MPANDFSKMQFEKGNIQFKDKREFMEAPIKGFFTRDGMRQNLQKLSNSLAGKKGAMIGFAFHYKKVNDWCPALYTKAGDNVQVWDPSDSDKGALYDGDNIDGCVFYVIKTGEEKMPTHHKPKKVKDDGFLFGKKK